MARYNLIKEKTRNKHLFYVASMTMFLKVKSQKQNADLLVNFLGRSCFLKLVNMSYGLQDKSNFLRGAPSPFQRDFELVIFSHTECHHHGN